MGEALIVLGGAFVAVQALQAATYLVGIVLALRLYRHYPQVAVFTGIAVVLLALVWVGQRFLLPGILQRTGLLSEIERWTTVFSLGEAVLRTTAIALLLAAVFKGRMG
ncbi:MAG: hypothetical protein D6803_06990 [Anaerolineae bacterium]|nr:MAG: hypothetical protein D6803_06990 [Anaerolineae bacterium]